MKYFSKPHRKTIGYEVDDKTSCRKSLCFADGLLFGIWTRFFSNHLLTNFQLTIFHPSPFYQKVVCWFE